MKKRLGIIFGGKSVEHEVSLQSARNVIAAVDPTKFDIVLIGIDHAGRWSMCDIALIGGAANPTTALPTAADQASLVFVPGDSRHAIQSINVSTDLPALDVIFPLVHGTGGEDGTLQGLLKLANVPFVGPDVLGSAVSMDKDVAKRLLHAAGVPVARWVTLNRRTAAQASFASLVETLQLPFFVKPANTGSSVGVSKVHNLAEWEDARDLALCYDHKILVEEYISGREIEVAVLGNEEPAASVAGEIIPQHEFYSYEAKYLDEHGALLRIPAELSAALSDRVRQLAVSTFKVLECSGMARVDFFVKDDGSVYVNEINTIPGFTRISMYPKLWEASGLPYPALIERLIELAIEHHVENQSLETSFQPKRID